MSYRRGPAAREMLTGRGWITDLSIRVRHFSGAACTAGGLTLLLLVLVLGRFLSLRRGPGDGAVAELGLDAIDRAVQQLAAFVLRVLEQARVVGAEGEARRLHADQSDRAEAAGSPRVEERPGRLPQLVGDIGGLLQRCGARDRVELAIADLHRHAASFKAVFAQAASDLLDLV